MADKQCYEDLRGWYSELLGREVWEAEYAQIERVIANLFGYHILQLGAVGQRALLDGSRILHRVVVDFGHNRAHLYALPEALPILTDSIDVIVLPHTLEFGDDPHEILREADRSLIPEGHLIVLGFNPWSLWGLRRLLSPGDGRAPWCGRFLGLSRLKDWLGLLGFDTVYVKTFFFRPPLRSRALLNRLQVMETIGGRGWPLPAGLYLLLAKKRVIALTPIRPRWRPKRRLIAAGVTEPTAGRR
jgi:SAM-dependent methyltransferase